MDTEALPRIPWDEHEQHIEAGLVQAIILNAINNITLVEAYSCHNQVTETMDTPANPKPMTLKEWIITQSHLGD